MTLSYDAAGSGPVVLLLHSSVCDRRMWDPQWQALLDAGFSVVRCDFRGFGETPAADRRTNDAEDVGELLDALGVGRAVVVGSSYGGQVALELAAHRPDRVGGLALLCTAVPDHAPTDILRAFDQREDELIAAGDIDAAVELNVHTWLGPDADAAVKEAVRRMQRRAFDVQLAAEDFDRIPVKTDLEAIAAPTLVVSGAYDLPDFRRIAESLPDVLPNARHVELGWAGHLPSLERPAEVNALVIGFLRELTGQTA
jgi:pimeloyl-ACP methyl ester carboxylesterase